MIFNSMGEMYVDTKTFDPGRDWINVTGSFTVKVLWSPTLKLITREGLSTLE